MRRRTDILENATAREYAKWLERHRSQAEMVDRLEHIFRERGPALSPRVRADLAEFLRERSAGALALCLALNDDPRDDPDFTAWVEEGA